MKNGFCWIDEAKVAFVKLKELMVTDLVLALPDFTEPFVLEINVSYKEIGAILIGGNQADLLLF